jgi:hypothetical protein
MRLLPISLCVSPAQHVVTDTDVFGSQFTLECVLASAPITVAGDGVSIEGHRDIVRHLLPGAQGIRTLMGFSTRVTVPALWDTPGLAQYPTLRI